MTKGILASRFEDKLYLACPLVLVVTFACLPTPTMDPHYCRLSDYCWVEGGNCFVLGVRSLAPMAGHHPIGLPHCGQNPAIYAEPRQGWGCRCNYTFSGHACRVNVQRLPSVY